MSVRQEILFNSIADRISDQWWEYVERMGGEK
jgi:hypothetical protein